MNLSRLSCALAMVMSLGTAASAAPVVYTFVSGDRAARAAFEMDGSDLVVTLTNTSAFDVDEPSDNLTAVFFATSASSAFDPVSAVLGDNAYVVHGPQPAGGDVSGEWAYAKLGHESGMTWHGISSTGLNLFGPKDRFDTSMNLAGPSNVGGMEYGIVSAGDDPNTGNAPVTGDNPFIKNEVVFRLTNLPANFDPSFDIKSLIAVYGTTLNDAAKESMIRGDTHAIPLPASFGSGVVLLALMGIGRRISRRHAA